MKICSISDCFNKVAGRGWCGKHYQRWYRYGDPLFIKQTYYSTEGVCYIKDCEEKIRCKLLCVSHYNRLRRHGDPTKIVSRRWKWRGLVCPVIGCHKLVVKSPGFCELHAARVKRNGDPYIVKMKCNYHNTIKVCTIEGCDKKHQAKEMCQYHYDKHRHNLKCMISGCCSKQTHYMLCDFHKNHKVIDQLRSQLWEAITLQEQKGIIDKQAFGLSVSKSIKRKAIGKAWNRLLCNLKKFRISFKYESYNQNNIRFTFIKIEIDRDTLEWWFKVQDRTKGQRVFRITYAA